MESYKQEIYDNFTGEEFLWYMAALKGLEKKYAKNRTIYTFF